MILDRFLTFTGVVASGTTVDSPTVTAASTNEIDLHGTNMLPVLANLQGARDMGIGHHELKLVAWVTVTFTGATSMQISLQGATDNGSGVAAAYSTWWSSPVYAEATLVAGAKLFEMDMPRPPAGIAIPRFLRLNYTIVGTHGAGSLFASIVLDRMDQMYQSTNNAILGGYPAGLTVAN